MQFLHFDMQILVFHFQGITQKSRNCMLKCNFEQLKIQKLHVKMHFDMQKVDFWCSKSAENPEIAC